jgi:hypothetical protein
MSYSPFFFGLRQRVGSANIAVQGSASSCPRAVAGCSQSVIHSCYYAPFVRLRTIRATAHHSCYYAPFVLLRTIRATAHHSCYYAPFVLLRTNRATTAGGVPGYTGCLFTILGVRAWKFTDPALFSHAHVGAREIRKRSSSRLARADQTLVWEYTTDRITSSCSPECTRKVTPASSTVSDCACAIWPMREALRYL